MRFRLTVDRARCDGHWLLGAITDVDDLCAADALLHWLALRRSGVPFRITPMTAVAAPALAPPRAATVPRTAS